MASRTKMLLLTAQVALSLGTLYGCYESPNLDKAIGEQQPTGGASGAGAAGDGMKPEGGGGRGGSVAANGGTTGGMNVTGGSGGAGQGGEGVGGNGMGGDGGPAIWSKALPPPCSDLRYTAQLEATGGAGERYTWEALSALPAGLQLDPRTGEVSGTPTSDGTFLVQVTDGNEVKSEPREFALVRRQTCWLAYLSEESEPSRLHYRDVFLNEETQVALPRVPVAGEAVIDFKFSPNGQWLAFRVGTPERYRLALYATTPDASGVLAPDATPISFTCPPSLPAFGCSVLDYAWSEGSRYLAVALSGPTEAQDYLSGLDVSRPEETWVAIGEARGVFEDIPLDYYGQLVWVGDDWLGFAGADPEFSGEPTQTLYTAFRNADGRSLAGLTATPSATYRLALLRSVPSGLVVLNPDSDAVSFFNRGPDLATTNDDVLQRYNGRLSPSGRLIAQTSGNNRLRIIDLSRRDAPPIENTQAICGQVVAWSDRVATVGVERVACNDSGLLKVFNYLDPPAAGLALTPTLTLQNQITLAQPLLGVRRGFSASASWLLLGAQAGKFSLLDLSLADSEGPIRTTYDSSGDVEFAHGQDVVAFSGVETLTVHRLPLSLGISRSYPSYGGATHTSVRCDEQGPERWCGASHFPSSLSYSPDSNALLFQGPSAVLWLADLVVSPRRDAIGLTARVPACLGDCRGNVYSFRPGF